MAEIVQLKNDSGTEIYPVTTGEAVKMTGNKTIDQAFSDLTLELRNTVQQDLAASKASFSGFYKGDNNNEVNYPIGSIVLAVSKFGNPGLLSRTLSVYIDSEYGYVATDPSYTSILTPGFRKLEGKWSIHGWYSISNNDYPVMLMQRVS